MLMTLTPIIWETNWKKRAGKKIKGSLKKKQAKRTNEINLIIDELSTEGIVGRTLTENPRSNIDVDLEEGI